MVPNANAAHFRLKAAQRDLIAAAGGIERAAEICSYGKSTVGRWSNIDSAELMPIDAVKALEEETGRFDFLEAYAAVRGRRIADRAGDAVSASDIVARFAEVMNQVIGLSSAASTAFADGKVTPTEATANFDRPAAQLMEALAELRKAAAAVRGDGGLSVVQGGAK